VQQATRGARLREAGTRAYENAIFGGFNRAAANRAARRRGVVRARPQVTLQTRFCARVFAWLLWTQLREARRSASEPGAQRG